MALGHIKMYRSLRGSGLGARFAADVFVHFGNASFEVHQTCILLWRVGRTRPEWREKFELKRNGMDDITFKDTRFDPDLIEFHGIARQNCEGLTACDLPGFAVLHKELAKHFEEKQIAEIAAIVINMSLWTRLKLAQGQVPVLES